jgi:hypothetical protein
MLQPAGPSQNATNSVACSLSHQKKKLFRSFQLQGRRHGHGTYFYANGEVYCGDFQDDQRHGFGRMQYQNGDVYEGWWEHDHTYGPGRLASKDADVIFEGMFVNGRREGLGTLLCISRVCSPLSLHC